jgi:MYXO-CTERM domain-containing protein
MRKLLMASLLGSTLAPAAAFGWESKVEEVQFKGSQTLLPDTDFTWSYNILSSPVSVDLMATADVTDKLEVTMVGDSVLEGPDPLTQHWKGQNGGASILLTSRAVIALSIKVGSSTTFSIYDKAWEWTGTKSGASFLLPGGGGTSLEVKVDPLDLINLDWTYPPPEEESSWSVTLGGSVEPDSTVVVKGQKLTTNAQETTVAEAEITLAAPGTNDGELDITSKWEGTADASFGVIFNPTLVGTVPNPLISGSEITIDLGSLFSYPWDLFSGESALIAETTPRKFGQPMPAIDVSTATLNFGTVDVGDSKTLDVRVGNDGDGINLEGNIEISGAGFSVEDNADDFVATATGDAIITVVFEPDMDGEFEGELVLESGDPSRPEVIIPLVGIGNEDEVVDDGSGGEDTDGDGVGDGDLKNGCGCVSVPANPASAGVFALGLAGLLARRRRR